MGTQRDTPSDLSPRKVAENLKAEGKERLERGKETAADQVDHVANALKNAGDELGGQSAIGNYASQFAGSISQFGQRLRDSSIEDLAHDMQAAARRNPAMFILGGLALGIVLSRLVKASAPQESQVLQDSESFSSADASTPSPTEWTSDSEESESDVASSISRMDAGVGGTGSSSKPFGE